MRNDYQLKRGLLGTSDGGHIRPACEPLSQFTCSPGGGASRMVIGGWKLDLG
jgi:hypothetical protein